MAKATMKLTDRELIILELALEEYKPQIDSSFFKVERQDLLNKVRNTFAK